MRGLSKWLIAVWVSAFALLVLNAGVSLYNVNVLIANDEAVSHSREVSRTLGQLMSSLKDAETGERGFIITKDPKFLGPFRDAETAVPDRLGQLEKLTTSDPTYESRLALLSQLIEKRFAILRRNIDVARLGGLDESRKDIAKGGGKEIMDNIRVVVAELEGHEEKILTDRSQVANARYRSSRFTAMLGGTLTVLMVAMAFVLVRVELARRQAAELEASTAALRLADEQKNQSETLAKLVAMRTAELESANHLLREEIGERTRAEARAQAATIELTRSNEELEKFAYVASHDLQEPLRKIQSFGDRLLKKCREALGPEGGEYVDRMQAAATRMRTLINDLLSFSRVTTNALPFSQVDLTTIVREVVDDLADRIEQTDARIDLGELPSIEADPLQMRQLFQNLIGNALKFHRAGVAPVIAIRATAWDQLPPDPDAPAPSRLGYRITVTDNGIGFDPSYSDRVFVIFQRLHSRNSYEGTGIGLAICRKIIQRHGGTISAHSREGEGSTFVIDLPAESTE